MSILVIRTHKRFGVRRKASLRKPGSRALTGLLIELSLEGCRISNIDESAFSEGQPVTMRIEGFPPREAYVRWVRDHCVGLRLVAPLHIAELDHIVTTCRVPAPAPVLAEARPVRAYGT